MLTQSVAGDHLSNLVLRFFNDSFIYMNLEKNPLKFQSSFTYRQIQSKYEAMGRVEMRQMRIPVLLLLHKGT